MSGSLEPADCPSWLVHVHGGLHAPASKIDLAATMRHHTGVLDQKRTSKRILYGCHRTTFHGEASVEQSK